MISPVRAAVVVVVLVGCYQPRVTPGVACTTECPGEQECIDGVCREPGYTGEDATVADDAILVDAMIDGAPNVDTDGDGLLDNVDNCRMIANADQHNEDGDAFGDACDPCPHVAMGGTADGDGDGVGDACDPEPTMARQHWVVFDPFTSRQPAWEVTSDAVFANDQMRLDGYIEYTIALTNSRVMTGGSVAVLAATPHQSTIQYRQGNGQYYYAEFYDVGNGGGLKITKYNGTDYIEIFSSDYDGVIPAAAFTWTVDMSVTNQRATLAATHGTLTFPATTGVTTAPALAPTTRLFFGSRNVVMTYDYVAIISTD